MKVGQYVKCVKRVGPFSAGNYYEILHAWNNELDPLEGGTALLRGDNGKEYPMLVSSRTQFNFVGDLPPSEPMFDLDDIELAEILMEEMKCRAR